jgi:hypothetical protein
LVHWRRTSSDGSVSYPFGTDARGTLIYAEDGRMSTMMTAGDRAPINGGDPLGGDPHARAAAYSTCLAYTGTWEREGDTVVHRIEESLYPNWADTVQPRSIEDRDGQLVLRTPPQDGPDAVVNEMAWARPGPPGR